MTHKHTQTLVADGLTKRYGRVTAVADMSFTVRSGAVTGFFGPNGAGKTTALKMLVGLARPTAGRAFINDGATPAPQPAPGPGHGILGMRERVAALGGVFGDLEIAACHGHYLDK